jgi:hypothetical protein
MVTVPGKISGVLKRMCEEPTYYVVKIGTVIGKFRDWTGLQVKEAG